jgi:arylformamidase
MHDAAWYEQQYNPRLTVQNVGALLDNWRRKSAITRNELEPACDIKYGPHRRENYDVFRVPNAKGTLIYVHGGYWRMLSKLETSFVAAPFVTAGYSVVLVNYPLCPDVTLTHIRDSIRRAFVHLWKETLTETERTNIVVTGHSAGGHLAAYHATLDWAALGLPSDAVKGIVALSGVFDVEPLIPTSMNADIRLTPESAKALNLMSVPLVVKVPILLAVGADEPESFHQQSKNLAAAWHITSPGYLSVAATNHFTLVDAFANPDHVLHSHVLAMLRVALPKRLA